MCFMHCINYGDSSYSSKSDQVCRLAPVDAALYSKYRVL